MTAPRVLSQVLSWSWIPPVSKELRSLSNEFLLGHLHHRLVRLDLSALVKNIKYYTHIFQ